MKEEVRKKAYKKAIDAEEARRKRSENAVEIRKVKRDENMMKRRMFDSGFTHSMLAEGSGGIGDPIGDSSTSSSAMEAAEGGTNAANFHLGLPELVQGTFSNNVDEQLRCTVEIRRLLSMQTNPPIDEVVQAGVVPALVQFLHRNDFPDLQYEAAWALTNIASGTSAHTNVVMEAGALPVFVLLLSANSEMVREQAVWALGNIAGDGPACRNLVLEHGAMEPLLARLHEATSRSMIRNSTWTLSNLCRGKPQPKFSQVRPALPMLASLIRNDDEDVIVDACWALSYLSDGDNDQVQEVIETNVMRRLVELLLYDNTVVQIPALRTIGNIVTGDDDQTEVVIRYGALVALHALLSSPRKSIRKEACWTISNITAGNRDQIQAVISHELVPLLVDALRNGEFDVKKEAAWAISNATYGGTPAQVEYLVECGCIEPLCHLLEAKDSKIIEVALEGLEQILKVGEREKADGINPFAQMIEECGGLDAIEYLQTHESTELYNKVVGIIVTYFKDDNEEVEAVAPIAGADGGFQFGLPAEASGQMPSYNFEEGSGGMLQ